MSKNVAIIFAGGSGARMGTGVPKQFLEVNGKPIIIHTLEIFEDHPAIDEIYVACKAEYMGKLKRLVNRFWITKVKNIVAGGETGQDSIYNALVACSEQCGDEDIVLIHDGVRPCIIPELIDDVIESVKENGSAITCTPMYETPVVSVDGKTVGGTPERSQFYTAQAPQSFYLGDILSAHEIIRGRDERYEGIVDSCTLMRTLGKEVVLVEGNRGNIKVTTPEDLYIFRAMIQYRETQDVFGLNQREVPEKLKK